MTTATTNSMNILLEKPSTMISAKVPGRMKDMLDEAAASLNMNVSQYIKLAIKERLEKDIRA
jgi:uncharacterized protein (DUF1778 family)